MNFRLKELEARRQEVEKLFENKPIEKPADWYVSVTVQLFIFSFH